MILSFTVGHCSFWWRRRPAGGFSDPQEKHVRWQDFGDRTNLTHKPSRVEALVESE